MSKIIQNYNKGIRVKCARKVSAWVLVLKRNQKLSKARPRNKPKTKFGLQMIQK